MVPMSVIDFAVVVQVRHMLEHPLLIVQKQNSTLADVDEYANVSAASVIPPVSNCTYQRSENEKQEENIYL